MRLSDRLKKIYGAVERGESVADIGTDHGYIPILLRENDISPRVILCDISRGSLDKAMANFRSRRTDPGGSDFRLGDGLETISAAEVDDIIIAGLGGLLIASILGNDIEKTRSFRKLILQPRNNSGELRYFLYVNGFDIKNEILSSEGKFICEIIIAVPGETVSRVGPYPSSDIRWKYPETFIDTDAKLLARRLDWKFTRIDEEIESLSESRSDNSARIKLLRKNKAYLEGLLEACILKGSDKVEKKQ